MTPPFSITGNILNTVADISQKLGKLDALLIPGVSVELRRENQIKTIYSSLVIEGNSLSKQQMTAILDGKPVIGHKNDILEVKNAINTYDHIPEFNPFKLKDFLLAHGMLMAGLIDDSGEIRSKNVGVIKKDVVAHMAPKHTFVPQLMGDLFDYINEDKNHMLITSSVFHYEVEFIHPFSDGNGRMGRLWQSVLLSHFNPLFRYIPVESLIRKNQQAYYDALEKSDKEGTSTSFIEFILEIINQTIDEFIKEVDYTPTTPGDRIKYFQKNWKEKSFTRKDYLNSFKTISTATASRDLKDYTDRKILRKEGSLNQSRYFFTEEKKV